MRRERALKVVLVLLGLVFSAGVYRQRGSCMTNTIKASQ